MLSRIVLTLLLALLPQAQGAGWTAKVLNQGDPIRVGGPIPLRLEITNPSTRPMEGTVDAVVTLDGEELLRHRSNPMVLVPGAQVVTDLLPALSGSVGNGQLAAHLHFTTSEGTVTLGDYLLSSASRSFWVVAHVCGDLEKREPLFLTNQPAALNDATDYLLEIPFRFRPLWMQPGDVPAQPLALSAYDTLVLHPEALKGLRPHQLEAVASWVDAGGTLVAVLATEPSESAAGREDVLLPFLQRLQRDLPEPSKDWPALEQRLREGPLLFHCGAGRVALYHDLEAAAGQTARRAKYFVAGLTDAKGEALGPALQSSKNRNLSGDALADQLLSEAPRPLSPATIFWMMAGFAIFAGAGDYFVLGWFRRRKYTWILFPVLGAAAAAGMLTFANQRMSRMEQRGTLRVVDIGLDGRVLREYRFTAILPSSTQAQDLETPAALGWELPLDAHIQAYARVPGYYPNSGKPSLGRMVRGEYEGSIAAGAWLRLHYRQWEPRVFRSFSLGGTDDSGLRWPLWKPTKEDSESSRSVRNQAFEIIYARRPPESTCSDLDPSSSYLFLIPNRMRIQSSDRSLFLGVFALTHNVDRAIESSLIGPLCAEMADETPAAFIVAVRKDGPNFTCYRKLQRVEPEQR